MEKDHSNKVKELATVPSLLFKYNDGHNIMVCYTIFKQMQKIYHGLDSRSDFSQTLYENFIRHVDLGSRNP